MNAIFTKDHQGFHFILSMRSVLKILKPSLIDESFGSVLRHLYDIGASTILNPAFENLENISASSSNPG